MVGDFTCNLSQEELDHYLSCRILVERVNVEDFRPKNRVRLTGLSLPSSHKYHYKKGRRFGIYKRHNEIIINKKVLRVSLNQDTRKRIFFSPEELERLDLSGSADNYPTHKRKSILKRTKNSVPSPKNVSFDEVVYITPISPVKNPESNSEDESTYNSYLNGDGFYDDDSNDELSYNPYLTGGISYTEPNGTAFNSNFFGESSTSTSNDVYNPDINGECSYSASNETFNAHLNGECSYSNSRTLNGAQMISEENCDNTTETLEQNPTEEMEEVIEIPKRKRGRPKKINPDPPFTPFATKKKPYIVPKKIVQSPLPDTGEPKRKRGRPRKKIVFGFHSIVSDIKIITLPSDLWSAHVSVTSKRSQVCFTRLVQPVSDAVPVECDRSVKFNGQINYSVKVNNRSVELLAAPKTVDSLSDIEILLQIVHDININDPVLRYLPR